MTEETDLRFKPLRPWLLARYGRPVHRVALDAGSTCPNRDGTKGFGGCTYCDVEGSGTGALRSGSDLAQQLRAGIRRIAPRDTGAGVIAYFQSYSNTYVDTTRLREVLSVVERYLDGRSADDSTGSPQELARHARELDSASEASSGNLRSVAGSTPGNLHSAAEASSANLHSAAETISGNLHGAAEAISGNLNGAAETISGNLRTHVAVPELPIVAVSLATRPDTLSDEALRVLEDLGRRVDVWLELGLEVADDEILREIKRFHTVAEFEDAVRRAKQAGLIVVGHAILGLPGDGREGARRTADALARSAVDGVKVHNLLVLRRTQMEKAWRAGDLATLELETYIDWLADFIERLSPAQVIHRTSADARTSEELAPRWKMHANEIRARLARELGARGTRQGSRFESSATERIQPAAG